MPAGAPVRMGTGLRPVINATGILLHGGLGRAPLSTAARAALDMAAATVDLEIDLATGSRGRRGRGALTALAAAVPAARAVHIVNNNTAALVLAAAALAHGREIVISRGELVETEDGLRLPELLTAAGARLREVGTTNRTTLGDYAEAIGPDTGFVLRVHPPGFRMVGFTGSPAVADLAELCAAYRVPLVGDPGSGLLRPEPALPAEPDVSTWLELGVSLVTTSGDKLLGGPQCGLLLGRADLIDRIRRHPLSRAVRPGKLTLAALEATLTSRDTPVHQSLHADPEELLHRAEQLAKWLRQAGVPASAVRSRAVVSSAGAAAPGAAGPDGPGRARPAGRAGRETTVAGGGGAAKGWMRYFSADQTRDVSGWPRSPSSPAAGGLWEVGLPSAALALDAALAGFLRLGRPPVLGRVEQGCCLLDLRAVPPELDPVLAAAVLGAAADAGMAAPADPASTDSDPDAATLP